MVRATPAPLERRVATEAQRASYSSRSNATRMPCWLCIRAVASALARSPEVKMLTRPVMTIPITTIVMISSTRENPDSVWSRARSGNDFIAGIDFGSRKLAL